MSVHTPAPDGDRPVTTAALRSMKAAHRPIVMLTAYDTPTARFVDEAGVDVILVGDSLGMAVLGYDSTLPVTLDDMLRHTAAVVRGTKHALVVGDMPFLTFQVSKTDAVRNAGRFLAEAGAHAVKLEGGAAIAPTVAKITGAGIPVMGHVGLTPQSVHQLGGYRTQAKETSAAITLVADCRALEAAGAFAIVLECIPTELAKLVSAQLEIPTIGIGAGDGCDGQVQVIHDILGMSTFTPRHAVRYAELGDAIRSAVGAYSDDVRAATFGADARAVHMTAEVLGEVTAGIGSGAVPDGEGL